MNIKIIYSFLFATFATIFLSALLPQIKPLFFVPFLVISFFNLSFISSLWFSFFGGAIVDLFSSTHMGMHALVYTFCAVLLYRQKKYFKDTLISITLYTVIVSMVYTFLNVILFIVFDKAVSISFIWFIIDFIGLSLLDGLYALLFFALPFKVYELFKKRKVIFED